MTPLVFVTFSLNGPDFYALVEIMGPGQNCTGALLHGGTLLHRDTFAREDTFARWDTFARRHFNTSITVRVGLGLRVRIRVKC